MRRALFDIIQALRGATRPLTAAALAKRLEVTSISPRCVMRSTRRGRSQSSMSMKDSAALRARSCRSRSP